MHTLPYSLHLWMFLRVENQYILLKRSPDLVPILSGCHIVIWLTSFLFVVESQSFFSPLFDLLEARSHSNNRAYIEIEE